MKRKEMPEATCHDCKNTVKGLFCSVCGQRQTIHCRYCSCDKIKSSDVFCCDCGMRLKPGQPTPSPPLADTPTSASSSLPEPEQPKVHKARMMVRQNGREGFDTLQPSDNLLNKARVSLTPQATKLKQFLEPQASSVE